LRYAVKNVEEVFPKKPVFKVRLKDAPLPKGWAVRYKSGAEEEYGIQPGSLLAQWSVDSEAATFSFSPDRYDMVIFDTEIEAIGVVDWLRENVGIETEALRFG
jgi:hypothetical protein